MHILRHSFATPTRTWNRSSLHPNIIRILKFENNENLYAPVLSAKGSYMYSLSDLKLGHKKTYKLLFDKFNEVIAQITVVWQYLIKVAVIVTGSFVVFSSAKGIFQENYTILPFDVPAYMEKAGITGNYTAFHLRNNVNSVQKIGWSIDGLHIGTSNNHKVDKDIVLFGVSFNTVKSLIRQGLGISDKAIRGNLILSQNRLRLVISVSDYEIIELEEKLNTHEDTYAAFDALMNNATYKLLQVIDPFVLASFYWEKADIKNSLLIIEQMTTKGSKDADSAYLIWGRILADEGDQAGAINKFKTATELNPNQYFAWTNWGTMLYRQKRYNEAIQKCKKALQINSDSWEATYIWAQSLSRLKKYNEAIPIFQRAIEINTNKFEAFNELSYVFQELGQTTKAIELLLLGITHHPEQEILYATLAEIYWHNGQIDLAYQSLLKANELGFDATPYATLEPYRSFLDNQKNER